MSNITDSQIEELKTEAGDSGDYLGVVCAMVALGEEPGAETGAHVADVFRRESGRWTRESARRECEMTIAYAAGREAEGE